MSSTNADSHSHRHGRVEDDQLLRGAGRFVADEIRDGQLFGVFLRSPHATARILSIDCAAAREMPGIVAVLTAADMAAAGLGSVSRHPPMTGRGGAKLPMPMRPALAGDRVMHIGEAVALVVGKTYHQALEGADAIAVDYEELPAVVDAREAIKPGAPQLWPEAPGNIALDWPGPAEDPDANAKAVDDILKSAARVAKVSLYNQRLIVASMEPRGATGSYDPATGRYTLRACSQSAGTLRDNTAAVMGIEPSQLRVITEDVGGAFGMKTPVYPEYPALLVAARITGRPVHWMATRSEAFMCDTQGRDVWTDAELALDERGKFLALRVRGLANLGAFIASAGPFAATNNFTRCFPGMYHIPKIDSQVRCVFTNTVPIGPYRGAGRPEANYVLERLVDEAARVSGIDPIKIRQRNFIPASAMPYKTAVGTTYDSGDFKPMLEKALTLADVAGFKQRRRESARSGKRRGIGLCCFLEHSGGVPMEGAAVAFPGNDTMRLAFNVQSTGQGHATVFPNVAAKRLGIPADKIIHAHGDSDLGIAGAASVASRSAMTAGSAILHTIDVMLAKGTTIAAMMLEAGEADIVYNNGEFSVVGTDRRVSLFDVAAHAAELAQRGEIEESLDTNANNSVPQTFPNGCHIAEVEIDPTTGKVDLVAYSAIDDCGNVLDSTIVHGQLHGSLAQGVGQALMEIAVYDPHNGQLLSGSFMDYTMPHADDMPTIKDDVHPVPATTNPLGVKGVGEAGTTAAIAAIMNAIADAIPGGAAAHLDMPATPEKVWMACQAAA